MKKINIWLVLLLTIVTLGIYPLFWFINRRKEMLKLDSSLRIPSVAWAVASFISMTVSPFAFLLAGLDVDSMLVIVSFVVGALLYIAAFIVAIWWIYEFSRSAEKITNGSISTLWSMILLFFAPVVLIMLQQNYFNKVGQEGIESKFSLVAIITIVLTLVVPFIIAFVFGLLAWSHFNKDTDLLRQKSESLSNDYRNCVDKLIKDFPEVTQDNKNEYNKAYDSCEDIRQQHLKAVNEYNSLINK